MPRRRLLAVAAAAAALLVGQARAELERDVEEPTTPAPGPPVPGCPVQAPAGVPVSSLVWTELLDGQPGWVSSPYKHELLPPISLPGFCDVSTGAFRSTDFRFVPSEGGEWLAEPVAKSRELEKTGEDCRQLLSGLDVMTAKPEWASLRLHFKGCGDTTSTIAVRVTTKIKGTPSTGTGEPTVEGIRLLDFMCALSPAECEKVRPEVLPEFEEKEKECVLTEQCPGMCDGAGTHRNLVPGKETAEACEAECQKMIDANSEDQNEMSCNGYSWSESEKKCLVFSGFPITTADESEEGFICKVMELGWIQTTTSTTITTTTTPAPVDLELSKLFDEPRAITMRRFQVKPYATATSSANCYSGFDWYILDRWLHVSEEDFAIMVKLGQANATQVHVAAPRSQIQVERVCVRDCAGKLRDECTAEEGVPPGAARYVPAPPAEEIMPPVLGDEEEEMEEEEAQDRLGMIDGDWRLQMRVTMGRKAFRAFADEQMQPWLAIIAVLAIVLGAGFTNVLRTSCAEPPPPLEIPSLQDATLVYEGEDGEVTVPLFGRGAPTGTDVHMMSAPAPQPGGPALRSTWQPRRAMNSAIGPMQSMPPPRRGAPPWGTRQTSPRAGGSMRMF